MTIAVLVSRIEASRDASRGAETFLRRSSGTKCRIETKHGRATAAWSRYAALRLLDRRLLPALATANGRLSALTIRNCYEKQEDGGQRMNRTQRIKAALSSFAAFYSFVATLVF